MRILTYVLFVVMAGLLYGIFVEYTGLAIPCLFRRVTGLKCPGCGATGMCIALMHLHFSEAFRCNPVLFVLLPPLAVVFLCGAADYVRYGKWKVKRWQNVVLYIAIALLVAFGIVRNAVEI